MKKELEGLRGGFKCSEIAGFLLSHFPKLPI
jgi:hypothetical protein